MQGSWSVWECVAEMRGGQRVRVWHWVLGSDSDDSGWAQTGQGRVYRGRYGHSHDKDTGIVQVGTAKGRNEETACKHSRQAVKGRSCPRKEIKGKR